MRIREEIGLIGCLLAVLALAVAGCGGSPAPTGPTPTAAPFSAMTVTGAAAAVGVGQPVQLVATFKSNSTTADVTAEAAWQSDNDRVAKVSGAGLVTPVGLGSAAISATDRGVTGVARVFVTVGSGPIGSCGSLSGSGSFTLEFDLQETTAPCVTFTGSAASTLDCLGHDAGSVSLVNVQSFVLRNCVIHGALDNGGAYRNLSVTGSTGVTVEHADVFGSVLISSCAGCALTNSTFVYPPSGHGVSCTEVYFSRGHDNQLVGSTIDGGWDGNAATWGTQGCDDAVVISDEVRPLIQGNTIRRAYDCGIEAVGSAPVSGAVIRDNTIDAAGYAGIGAWYVAGWRDSVFSGNTVTNSPDLMTLFVDSIGARKRGYVFTEVALVNNQFVSNTFAQPVPSHYGDYIHSMYVNMNSNFIGIVDNNLVRGNNFGTTTTGPLLDPALGFVDGGGNVCQPSDALPSCKGRLGLTIRTSARSR